MEVSITGLTKRFGTHRALDGVDLEFGTGMLGLLGPNGAGKTTLMRILTGILRPGSGEVRVGGHRMSSRAGRNAVKRTLGYLPQHLDLYPDLTAREFLDYIGLLKGIGDRRARRDQAAELLERVGLGTAADRRMGGFSGGMRRRVGIAQALMGDPRLIVVDEPTAGLDPEERMRFRALLAGLGERSSVVLSTHVLDDVAQTCARVAVLADGRLLFHGRTADLTGAADGRTFAVETSGPQPDGPVTVVNGAATATGMRYRVVAESPPAGAVPVAPTLEDGYAATMRDARAAGTAGAAR